MTKKKNGSILKRTICGLLAAAMILTAPAFGTEVFAVATQQKKEKAQAEKDLNKVNNQINKLNNDKSAVSNQLDKKEKELEDLMNDIKSLKKKMVNKQKEIDQCNDDLDAAEVQVQEEYEAMKLRIQYMYENSISNSLWSAVLESNGLTDMLNRMEYITEVYEKDRELLDSFQLALERVEELKEKLTDDMEDLTDTQVKLDKQEKALEKKIASLESQKATYASQLKSAKALAAEYKSTIASLGKTIQKAEEAAAKAAAEAERRRQQQLAAQQAAANRRPANSSSSRPATTTSSSSSHSSSSGSSSSSSKPKDEGNYDPAGSTGVSGAAIVSYACQFVGGKYVWGGNSLTSGVDCSGFVHLVFAHFGISTPRYSQAFLRYGKKVSTSNAKAGDIIVYPGHVAIYMGNGKIVEAQSSKAGITNTRSAFGRTINGIRRYY